MRYYIGVDWADAVHAIWVEDERGARVLERAVPHTAEGLAEWGRWLDEQRASGAELWAAIERPDGRVVDFLLDHGVLVYPINPKALDRARDRYRMNASKSDPFDAHVLAAFLRTDHAHLHALQPSSAAAQELKLLTRDYARLVRDQTRLVNQLTATLKEYYPRALEVCGDVTTKRAAAFLRAYPTRAALAACSRAKWLRFGPRHRWNAEQAAALWELLRHPQLPVPEQVGRAKHRLVLVLLRQLETVVQAVDDYRKAVMECFGQLPAAAWALTLPASQGTLVPHDLGGTRGRGRPLGLLAAPPGPQLGGAGDPIQRQVPRRLLSLRVQPPPPPGPPAIRLLLAQVPRVGAGLLRLAAGARPSAPGRVTRPRGEMGEDPLRAVDAPRRL